MLQAGTEFDVLIAHKFDLPEGSYSTDDAAVWQLVYALQERRAYISNLYQMLPHAWVCTFMERQRREVRGIGETPAMAICRAAYEL